MVPGLGARDRAAFDLQPIVDRIQPDVVHLHNVMNPAVLEWAATQRSLTTVHDHRAFCPASGKLTRLGVRCDALMDEEACGDCFTDASYFASIYATTRARRDALRALRCHVLSRYMQAELQAAGVPAERIHRVPPIAGGLELEAEPTLPRCVLFVGRLVSSKGVLDALEAWKRSGVELPFIAVGTGSQRQEVEAAGAKVMGWRPHGEMSGIYRSAAVLVMPSRWQEPFGLVGLEAQSLGVPVAAWASGGVIDWHGEAGLVAWGDVDGLAARIRVLVTGSPAPEPLRHPVEPLGPDETPAEATSSGDGEPSLEALYRLVAASPS